MKGNSGGGFLLKSSDFSVQMSYIAFLLQWLVSASTVLQSNFDLLTLLHAAQPAARAARCMHAAQIHVMHRGYRIVAVVTDEF